MSFIILTLLAAVSGCQTASHTDSSSGQHSSSAPILGPVVLHPGESVPHEDQTADRPRSTRGPGVELLLGEGLSTGFAYQGAVKALHEWKVKLTSIHAYQIGALVAVSYAETLNANRMDWSLARFSDGVLGKKTSGLVFAQGDNIEGRIEKKLKEAYESKNASSFKIPVILPVQAPSPLHLWEQLRVSLVRKDYLTAYSGYSPVAYDRFREEFLSRSEHPQIIIEVKSSGNSELSRDEAGNVLKLTIALSNVPDLDFKRKTQAAYSGRQAMDKWKTEVLAFLRTEDRIP
ncbi:MAG: hypothetical protein EOP09_13115 [Proteobacteria bacterium]|nr:MAG: hypothetical protein EOP09_13115 [Pseudomonadota bacterium]